MSDPRNVAHAKKVTQEKKHDGTQAHDDHAPAVQPGKKPAMAKKHDEPAAAPDETAAAAVLSEDVAVKTPATLEASLIVLGKLKELEFHSRANLERLAEVTMTVEDELKQKAMVTPLGEVYSAQSVVQTKLTTLIDAYKAECDRLQGEGG